MKDNQYRQTMLPLSDLINGKQSQNLIAYTRKAIEVINLPHTIIAESIH